MITAVDSSILICIAKGEALAGRIHAEHRRQGGPREHLMPDFLIAAHAAS